MVWLFLLACGGLVVGGLADDFVRRAESVVQAIETYANSNGQEISLQDLEIAKREIKKMISSVRGQTLPSKQARYRPLTRLILDRWPLGHKLGVAISELEEEYVRLLVDRER
ncbi:MAG TPA: hypothetical protein PLJ78_17590 [Anaerolineae bacterium]|nr:hypothetical protein [Anaerolineae bacterium]HQK15745.1 hypothetical protein [Anaerolineae bacterium]